MPLMLLDQEEDAPVASVRWEILKKLQPVRE